MNDVRYPTKLFDSFHYTSHKENASFIVIVKTISVFVFGSEFSLKLIFIIYKIYLHAGCLNRCDLYDQGMVCVIDNEIHSRKSYHFV